MGGLSAEASLHSGLSETRMIIPSRSSLLVFFFKWDFPRQQLYIWFSVNGMAFQEGGFAHCCTLRVAYLCMGSAEGTGLWTLTGDLAIGGIVGAARLTMSPNASSFLASSSKANLPFACGARDSAPVWGSLKLQPPSWTESPGTQPIILFSGIYNRLLLYQQLPEWSLIFSY